MNAYATTVVPPSPTGANTYWYDNLSLGRKASDPEMSNLLTLTSNFCC